MLIRTMNQDPNISVFWIEQLKLTFRMMATGQRKNIDLLHPTMVCVKLNTIQTGNHNNVRLNTPKLAIKTMRD